MDGIMFSRLYLKRDVWHHIGFKIIPLHREIEIATHYIAPHLFVLINANIRIPVSNIVWHKTI